MTPSGWSRRTGNPLGAEGVALLCRSEAFRRLTRLRLDQHSFGRSEQLRQAFGARLELESLVLPSMSARL
jgi:hypothetical protein